MLACNVHSFAIIRYKKLLSGPDPEGRSRPVPTEHVISVFGEYAPWEIEELVCVHHYVLARLRKLFRRMEDDFVRRVASTEQKSTFKYLASASDDPLDLRSEEAETTLLRVRGLHLPC